MASVITPPRVESVALGAVHPFCHDEQSLAPHGISGFGRAEYSCRNAIAQPFQWWDDCFKLSVSIPRYVLSEDNIRPALAGDTDDFGSEEALAP